MLTHRYALRLPGLMTLSLVFIIAHATPTFANLGAKVVGSYLLRQDDGFWQILTLGRKGTALSQNNGQFLGTNQFGDQQGAWKKSAGERKLIIKTLDFTFDTVEDVFTGFGRSTFNVEFEKRFDRLFGPVLVEIFGPHQDPLDPDATPMSIFGPTYFTGKRITANLP